MKLATIVSVLAICILPGCSHKKVDSVSIEEAARLNRSLVREAVVFEPGTEQGAIVPDVSSPRLRAEWVEEHRENNRLIEGHRQWVLEGDVILLGIPKQESVSSKKAGIGREN